MGRGLGNSSGPNGTRTRNSSNNSNNAFNALMTRVQSLSFRSFQMCVLLWLGAKGFEKIRPLGRHFQRGRRSFGGADFLATMPSSNVDVAVQVRHWKTPVQRRAVDELWGFMLRQNIPLGLIVTNSSFMNSAQEAVLEYPGRPVQPVSCRELCGSMAALELGLRKRGSSWVLDEPFFGSLSQLSLASAPAGPFALSRSATNLAARCHVPDLGGEAGDPGDRPPSLAFFLVSAVALVLLRFLIWMRVAGGR